MNVDGFRDRRFNRVVNLLGIFMPSSEIRFTSCGTRSLMSHFCLPWKTIDYLITASSSALSQIFFPYGGGFVSTIGCSLL